MHRRCRALIFHLLAPWLLAVLCAAPNAAAAQTCFHACLTAKKLRTDVTDQMLRDDMQSCHDSCERAARARLVEKGLGPLLAACIPEPIAETDLRKIRSASPSVVAFANAFTWDVNNVLPDRIIRRVELATQTMSLEDLIVTASGYVEPGGRATFYIGNVADGYPSLRVTTRIKAIYACPLH